MTTPYELIKHIFFGLDAVPDQTLGEMRVIMFIVIQVLLRALKLYLQTYSLE